MNLPKVLTFGKRLNGSLNLDNQLVLLVICRWEYVKWVRSEIPNQLPKLNKEIPMPQEEQDWFKLELHGILSRLIVHYSEPTPGHIQPSVSMKEAETKIKDLIITLVEQESFIDPETKQQTFYTEQLVKRLRAAGISE